MKHLRIIFLFSTLFMIVVSACAPATPTGCNQTGCPYPAVCEQSTGQCVINQPQGSGPGSLAPTPVGAGQIENNPGSGIQVLPTATMTASPMPPPLAKNPGGAPPQAVNPGNVPVVGQTCQPPAPSVSNINSFCANLPTKTGGATFQYSPALSVINHATGNVSCDYSKSPVACSGPANTSFQEVLCTSCWYANPGQQPWGQSLVCASGYALDASNYCMPVDPSKDYSPCPPGAHYDNAMQACVDDTTSAVNPQCPAGYPNYIPDMHMCLPQNANPPEVFNCQTFNIPLGVCEQIKSVCQPPAGGCAPNPLNGQKRTWNQATCSCQ